LGETVLQKMEISESFFGKNHGKLAHGKNFASKIFLANNFTIYQGDGIVDDHFLGHVVKSLSN
jgi:hypothetical protein